VIEWKKTGKRIFLSYAKLQEDEKSISPPVLLGFMGGLSEKYTKVQCYEMGLYYIDGIE
jgi:hypothetical protein